MTAAGLLVSVPPDRLNTGGPALPDPVFELELPPTAAAGGLDTGLPAFPGPMTPLRLPAAAPPDGRDTLPPALRDPMPIPVLPAAMALVTRKLADRAATPIATANLENLTRIIALLLHARTRRDCCPWLTLSPECEFVVKELCGGYECTKVLLKAKSGYGDQVSLKETGPERSQASYTVFTGYSQAECILITVDFHRDGRTVRILGVNGYAGQVWYHTRRGAFMIEKEIGS